MRLTIRSLRDPFHRRRTGRASDTMRSDRQRPSIFQYDYLVLDRLSSDLRTLIGSLPAARPGSIALDIGSGTSPYAALLREAGYTLRTLDIVPDTQPDLCGTAEHTGLPAGYADVVLLTQVLEHTDDPWQSMRELRRVLKPGGHLIASVPHVWFYHPHPHDHWRFTQEGILRLCESVGFDVLELHSQGGSALAFFQIVCFLLYGVFGRMGAPLYGLLNLIGAAADRAISDELFCINFAWLARPLPESPHGDPGETQRASPAPSAC